MMRTEEKRARRLDHSRAPKAKNRLHPAGLTMLFLGLLTLTACDLLDVDNPNSLVQDDLETPASAAALANGALATVQSGVAQAVLLHAASSDELVFTGSRDAWIQLQEGDLRDPANEFSDAAWPSVAQGRWMADEAVRLLSGFDADGELTNRNLLASAHLYSAIMRTYIADVWEDFVFSDRRDTQPPIGEANMLGLYDDAIASLGSALTIAQATGSTALEQNILAQRARTRHARAVRAKFTPAGTTAADPLVNDPAVIADAEAALAMGADSWQFRFIYDPTTIGNAWGGWVNERLELRPSDDYVVPTANDKQVESIRLEDPIDAVPDPALTIIIEDATTARNWPPLTIVSARELLLILAEAELAASGGLGGPAFNGYINRVRALDGVSDYTGQIPALDILRHQRMAGLYLTGRRLADHYRFGTVSPLWNPNASASTRPGTLFPIAQIERTSNCHLLGVC
jgi:starch-binding outer membrane protein, SusD/RagB family